MPYKKSVKILIFRRLAKNILHPIFEGSKTGKIALE